MRPLQKSLRPLRERMISRKGRKEKACKERKEILFSNIQTLPLVRIKNKSQVAYLRKNQRISRCLRRG